MQPIRMIAAVLLLAVAGCGRAAPDNSILEPGSHAVIAPAEGVTMVDFRPHPGPGPLGAPLPAGTLVRVGHDPGSYLRYMPPDDGARYRKVAVVVADGEFLGRPGEITRMDLRPAP